MKKITLLVIASLLLSGIGYQYRAITALTPPEKDYPIKIKSISVDGIKDDNTKKEMVNFAIGNLKPKKEAIFEVQLEGDLSLISHMRVLYGRNNNSSLINSDEILVHRFDIDCANQNCATIRISVVIPDSSKGCWIKFWPIIVSKDAKIIGGANTRPWSLCNYFYPPQISTADATDITYQSATLNGDMWITGNAPPTYVWFSIRKDGDDYDPNQMLGFNQFEKRDTFSYQIEEGLLPNQLYYFKAFAGNLAGVVYGSEKSFKTLPAPPKVKTLPATEVNMKEWVSSWEEVNAKLNLEVTDHGNADYLDIGWYWYDKNEKPITIYKTEPVRIFGPFEKGQKIPLSEKFYFLDSSSTYITNAYVINEKGMEGRGDDVYFPPPYETLPIQVETMSKKDDHQWNQVTLYANLKLMGISGPCEVWFDYCDGDNFLNPAGEWKESEHITVNKLGEIKITITGLPSDRGIGPWWKPDYPAKEILESGILDRNIPGWIYRAHAKNSFGQESIDEPSFKNGEKYYAFGTRFHPEAPIIKPLEATNITHSEADINLGILWTGFDTKLVYWAEYWGDGKKRESMELIREIPLKDYSTLYYRADLKYSNNLLSVRIRDLKPNTQYTVQIYAATNTDEIVKLPSNRRNKWNIYKAKVLIKFTTKNGKEGKEYTGPIIETIGYDEISQGDVILHGKLIEAGNSEWIKCWVEFYFHLGAGSASKSKEEIGTLQNTNTLGYPPFDIPKYGLGTNVTFSFCFVAENNIGQRSYGKVFRFTTNPRKDQAVKPKISLKIFQITATSLAVDGYIETIGQNLDGKPNNLDIYFWAGEYINNSEGGHMLKQFKSQVWENINSLSRVSWFLTGLSPGKTYAVQFYAEDKTIFTWAGEKEFYRFDTPIFPPEFKANKAEYITDTKALLNADVSYLSSSGTCEFWIEWGESKHGEFGESAFENKMPFKKFRTEGSVVGDTLPKGFSWEANNLKPNTYYVYRVISEPLIYKPGIGYVRPTGSQGVYPSNEYVFKTKPAP